MTFVRRSSARILEQERQREAASQAAIDAVLSKPPPPGVTKDNWIRWNIGMAGSSVQQNATEPAPILPVVSAASASAWPSSGLPATAHHSDERTGLAAAPGPGKASPVWSGSSLAKDGGSRREFGLARNLHGIVRPSRVPFQDHLIRCDTDLAFSAVATTSIS